MQGLVRRHADAVHPDLELLWNGLLTAHKHAIIQSPNTNLDPLIHLSRLHHLHTRDAIYLQRK